MLNTDLLDQEVQSLFQRIRTNLTLPECPPERLEYYIKEHSGFSRHNPMLLSVASDNSQSAPAISVELQRNSDEESGASGEESHFAIYTDGLRESFQFKVDEYVLSVETKGFLETMLDLCKSGSASKICGVFYATEAGAIPELELVRNLTDLYSTSQENCQPSEKLTYFFDLHLNGVEQEHKDGLGTFINHYEQHSLNLSEIHEGFSDSIAAMDTWWNNLKQAVIVNN
ncbi:DUF3865 domain-containing protein [Moorena sp. SIO3I8]|uniref:DUF3865 domain-containing protein n=1 Tax=Moorena sp. SIO3I8 TaxID=2607833 RepID=UPI0013C02571|nr:DUF3865 domain-containing protein [Moorena sp. SIO3I8]NEO05381.1 DUF3865 domain-containing protein [Moorena sp. SIO3I8]